MSRHSLKPLAPEGQAASKSQTLVQPAFQPGDYCDKYQIISLLAFGGIGEVYKAVQRGIDRPVALKCLQFRHVDKGDLRARMDMEAKGLGRISHPNVVTVYDMGYIDSGIVWIAMELLVGQTLRKLLRSQRRLPLEQALRYALDIAEGVSAAHREKIIHRDLKPDNVFVTERDIIKVLDLGTAKFQGWGGLKTTNRGRVIGTPAYMSPEHIRCIRVDARSDIYALGLMLYEMVAEHPFEHITSLNDYHELARLQLVAQPRPLPELLPGFPEPAWTLIEQMLSKAPERRPQSMDELISKLRWLQKSLCPPHPELPSGFSTRTEPMLSGQFMTTSDAELVGIRTGTEGYYTSPQTSLPYGSSPTSSLAPAHPSAAEYPSTSSVTIPLHWPESTSIDRDHTTPALLVSPYRPSPPPPAPPKVVVDAEPMPGGASPSKRPSWIGQQLSHLRPGAVPSATSPSILAAFGLGVLIGLPFLLVAVLWRDWAHRREVPAVQPAQSVIAPALAASSAFAPDALAPSASVLQPEALPAPTISASAVASVLVPPKPVTPTGTSTKTQGSKQNPVPGRHSTPKPASTKKDPQGQMPSGGL